MTSPPVLSYPSRFVLMLWLVLLARAPLTAQEAAAHADTAQQSSWASDLGFTLSGRYWRPSIDGNIFITKGGQPGSATKIDLHDDLNLDPDNAPQGGLDISLGSHRLGFQYLPLSFAGTSTLRDSFIFHNAAYPAGERVKSEIGLTLATFRYDYRIFNGTLGDLRIGLQGYYWKFDSRIKGTGPGGSLNEHRGFSSLLPAGTASGQMRFGLFHVNAGAAGGALSDRRFIFEIEGSVGVRLWGHLDLDAGYRYLDFHFKETTNKGELEPQGPFFQVSLTF